MDALTMTLLFDYYGGMLTEKQRECLDMRYNQDLSLGEIAQAQGVSRQAVYDNLTRAEALLCRMEENIGAVRRDKAVREAAREILDAAGELDKLPDLKVLALSQRIQAAVTTLNA